MCVFMLMHTTAVTGVQKTPYIAIIGDNDNSNNNSR